MGGRFWLQSNYTDCPQDLFDFRDTNCDIKTARVESPYLFTDSRTKLRIGFYDYGTLFGYPSGAIQEINFQFVGWRIDNKGTLSTGLPVKVISNDESNQ